MGGLAVEAVVVVPPQFGYLVFHGFEVVAVVAGYERVALVAVVGGGGFAGYLDPPAVAAQAFIEDDVDTVAIEGDGEAFVLGRIAAGEVAQSVVAALDKEPKGVGVEVGGLSATVVGGIHFKQAKA